MKFSCFVILFLFSSTSYAQFAVKNYSNAPVDQIATIQQIADWIQFHKLDNTYPLFSNAALIDKAYLNIESTYLSKEYSKDKIDSIEHIKVNDGRQVFWYERNIFKISKQKLKPRYQIYITLEYSNGIYSILDLKLSKNKKINTSLYDQN